MRLPIDMSKVRTFFETSLLPLALGGVMHPERHLMLVILFPTISALLPSPAPPYKHDELSCNRSVPYSDLLQLLREVLTRIIIIPTFFPQMRCAALASRRDFAVFRRPVCETCVSIAI